jgi:single-stranded DNA-binding protein
MRNTSNIELIGYVYQDARCPNEANYPNWVVFKLCVNRKYKTKSGEEKQDTSWYECKTNSEGMAKICKQYVKDKMGLLVKGIPKAKAFTDSTGNPQANIEVLVTEINMLTSPKEKDADTPQDNGRFKIGENNQTQEVTSDIQDDEIPF